MPPWLPNLVTTIRVLLIPVFLVLAARCQETGSVSLRGGALVILLVLGGSDVLDGWLARRFHLGTALGAMLDAVADRLAQVAILAFFTISDGTAFQRLPPWFLALVVTRDLAMVAGWLTLRRRRGRVTVVHEAHGKLASFLVFVLVVWLTIGLPPAPVPPALGVIAVLIVASTWAYVRAGFRQLHAG